MMQLRRCAVPVAVALIAAAGPRPAEGQATAPGRTFQVNGMEMYAEIRGTGEPLVLLHGFSGCGQAAE